MLKDFKKFALKGNMIDLAIAVIIGGAFTKLITSLVNDIIMPCLSIFVGKLDFSNLFITVDGSKYDTIAQAQEAGIATINYGTFISGVINFSIMAFVVFIVVRQLTKLHKKPEIIPTEKTCPFCKTKINIDATKCPNCTSSQG
ncbi:large conductance mechanosensitive channel protein MscL [Clostridium vincentii]|uniref:Large-conductance mechanosensitive channel n=1 Tax=Clostridium vincentii TaxID=52704 RepID=A0A2T0BBN4_9CLOT|nr:large conductance mechanosensitive channel protein MscL [Clostridium vincentii]PRR81255.1 Large-conductance mechanosensitive channel [Clostridium vincentii]